MLLFYGNPSVVLGVKDNQSNVLLVTVI